MDLHHHERRTTWLSGSTGLINPSTTRAQILTREAPWNSPGIGRLSFLRCQPRFHSSRYKFLVWDPGAWTPPGWRRMPSGTARTARRRWRCCTGDRRMCWWSAQPTWAVPHPMPGPGRSWYPRLCTTSPPSADPSMLPPLQPPWHDRTPATPQAALHRNQARAAGGFQSKTSTPMPWRKDVVRFGKGEHSVSWSDQLTSLVSGMIKRPRCLTTKC